MIRHPAAAALAGVTLVLLAACARQSELPPVPQPPSTQATTSTTAPVDFSQVALPTVPGRTTTTGEPWPYGTAFIEGAVLGPQGPVEGATVRVERFTPSEESRTDLVTGPGGTFSAPALKGGRYRVRAWRVPDLTAPPQVFFLGATDRVRLEFRMDPRVGTAVSVDIAPKPPEVGDPAELLVLVTTRSVDQDGVVRAQPVRDILVGLSGSGAWRVLGPNPVFTDPQGQSSFLVVCGAGGAQPLIVVVNGVESFPLNLPACRVPPPPTTTTTGGAGGPTTTARRTTPTTAR